MSIIRAFRPFRPIDQRVSQVAAVPYDVVNREEARQLAKDNPWNFLHVSRPEIDLAPEIDPYSPRVYEQAANQFEKFIETIPLIQDNTPCLYLYRLQMGDHVQTGVVGCFSIDEYDHQKIKKHEKTRPDKEDDRTRHILALSAQTGPVLLAYRDVEKINHEINQIQKSSPLYQFETPDHIFHTVWKIQNPRFITELFQNEVDSLYIADGHHRAAAASRVRSKLSSNHQDADPHFVFGVAFPASQLKILPYHRSIRDLNGLTPSEFLEKIQAHFEVKKGSSSIPDRRQFGMFLERQWYLLVPKFQILASDHDVDLLQKYLLEPLLGIADPRTNQRIDFIGGIRGTQELEHRVQSKKAAVCFSLHPSSLEEVMSVADLGGIMPPKSTWFEPKLRDGIFCFRFSEKIAVDSLKE